MTKPKIPPKPLKSKTAVITRVKTRVATSRVASEKSIAPRAVSAKSVVSRAVKPRAAAASQAAAPRKKTRARKRPALRHDRHPFARPISKTMGVFWSTGMLGGVMVVTAALWSAWRTPEPTPNALPVASAVSAVAPVARTPASADPPNPIQESLPPSASAAAALSVSPAEQPQQQPQQQQQQGQSPPGEDVSIRPSEALLNAFSTAGKTEHRLSWWSRWLANELGAHAALSSLGSGPSILDPVPLIPARFNCTTFVETVSSLARSERPQLFFQRLIEMRYHRGKSEFLSRNHIPESDWIPHNVDAGILSDITSSVARESGTALGHGEKSLDRGAWLAARKKASPAVAQAVSQAVSGAGALPPEWSGSEELRVDYIPAASLGKVASGIPDGTIINFVRKNTSKKPVLISHQGIVVREKGRVLLRHSSPGGHVRTVVLRDYLRRNGCFVGFTLNQVNEPAKRESG